MKLSKTAEYALSVMEVLGSSPETSTSTKALHETLGIPYRYTTKVLRLLLQADLVTAEQGREGGYRLARPADTIMLYEIIEAVEPGMTYDNCIMGREKCDAHKPCALHDQWAGPRQQIRNMFRNTPLSSLSSK